MSRLDYIRKIEQVKRELEALAAFERSLGRPKPAVDAVRTLKQKYPELADHPIFRVGGEEE